MSPEKIDAAVDAYRDLTPESIDAFRALSDDEAVATKLIIARTEGMQKKPGRKRKRASVGSLKSSRGVEKQ